ADQIPLQDGDPRSPLGQIVCDGTADHTTSDHHHIPLMQPVAPLFSPLRRTPDGHDRRSSRALIRRAAPSGFGLSIRAERTATPAQPVSITRGIRSALIPPMARTGTFTARTTRESSSSPFGGIPGLDGVENTWPNIR